MNQDVEFGEPSVPSRTPAALRPAHRHAMQSPCTATAIASVAVAACLVAVVWAMYAAFDLQVFDLQQAVWHRAPEAAQPSAVAHMLDAGTAVVAGAANGTSGPTPAVR